MSWGIDFNFDLFINKEDYKENISLVKNAIDDLNELITDTQIKFCMLGAATPVDAVGDEWKDEPLTKIQYIINEEFEALEEYYNKKLLLTYYKEYLKEKQNKNK